MNEPNRRPRTLKCPALGCDHVLIDLRFESEEALISPSEGLERRPLTVERNFSGICPQHGEVWVAATGHHISSRNTIGYEADAEWQKIAFAARNIDRKF